MSSEGNAGGAFIPSRNYDIPGTWAFTGTLPTLANNGSVVGTTGAQTLASKTLTSPVVNTPTIASPSISGNVTDTAVWPLPTQSGAAAGAVAAITETSQVKLLADNTATDFFTVTVPNAIHGAAIDVFIASALGDGDSTDSCRYSIGVSRVAGAATKATVSTKSVVGATTGATANAVITASVSSMTGAVGATQTFTVQIKNARSAGAAANHPTVAVARLVNLLASGITIAAV